MLDLDAKKHIKHITKPAAGAKMLLIFSKLKTNRLSVGGGGGAKSLKKDYVLYGRPHANAKHADHDADRILNSWIRI